MKKTISLILCFAMLLSTVAFCLPAVAAEIEFGVESSEDYQVTPEETDAELEAATDKAYAALPLVFDFEDGESGSYTGPLTLTHPDDTTVSVVDGAEGKALSVNVHGLRASHAARVVYNFPEALPAGRYQLSFDITVPVTDPPAAREVFVFYKTPTSKGPDGKAEVSPLGYDKTGQSYLPRKAADITGSGTVSVTWDYDQDETDTSFYIAVKKTSGRENLTYTLDNIEFKSVPITANIVFDANGGTGSQEPIVSETGKTVTLPAESGFTREFYDFKGWSRSKEAAPADVVATYDVLKADMDASSNITFYAVWERRTYDVKLNLDGGMTDAETTYTANEGENCVFTLPTATQIAKKDYMLIGWKDSADNEYKPGETVTVSEADTFTALYLDISEFGTLNPVSGTGYDGKTKDVDPRYPGIVYTFDEPLDPETITLGNIGVSDVETFDYDEEANTLTLFPKASGIRRGSAFSIPTTKTMIMNKTGDKLVSLFAVTRTLASEIPAKHQYENMIPYGDYENGFLPLYTPDHAELTKQAVETEELEDGSVNTYFAVRTDLTKQAWPHIYYHLVKFELGATYKVTAAVKSLGSYPSGSHGSQVTFDAVFNGIVNEGVKDSFAGAGSARVPADTTKPLEYYKEHITGAYTETEWKTTSKEFHVDKVVSGSDFSFALYPNPNKGEITQFAVDDLAIYKRMDVTYSAGVSANLIDGETAPEVVGAYLDGTDAHITLSETVPYEAADPSWTIDSEKPWMDQFGNTYAAGAEVDLAAIGGPLSIVPNVIPDGDYYTVNFVGDVQILPAPVKVPVGTKLDLAKVEDCKSAVSGKRFNGWKLNPDDAFSDILHGEINVAKDMTLYADISYNIDFAIPANNEGWEVNGGKLAEKMYNGLCIRLENTGTNNDAFLAKGAKDGIAVPMAKYKAVRVLYDAKYAQEGKGENPFKVGASIEGVYFGRSGEGATGSRLVGGKVDSITDDGLYAVATFNMYTHKDWVGTLNYFRLDTSAADGKGYAVRSIEFIEADAIDDAALAITDIDVPVTGETIDYTAAETSGAATISSVTWTPENYILGKLYNEDTVYTVHFDVSPAAGNCFVEGITATVNGKEAVVKVNDDGTATISYTFPMTDAYLEYEMSIVGPDTIATQSRAAEYSVSISNKDVPTKTATWSVDDPSKATIDAATGKLIPITNGTVVITATSDYNPLVVATKTVTFENQTKLSTLTYNPGTTDIVTGMPASEQVAGTVSLSAKVPVRAGYIFLGWAANDESVSSIDKITVTKDTTVYALWGKGKFWHFGTNGTMTLSGKGGTDQSTLVRGENYDQIKTTINDMRFSISLSGVDPEIYRSAVVRISSSPNADSQIYYKSKYRDNNGNLVSIGYDTNSYAYAEAMSMRKRNTSASLDDVQTLVFDFYNSDKSNTPGAWKNGLAEEITNIYVDPCKSPGATFRIEYFGLLESAGLTFDPNTTDEVTGMPESTYAAAGESYTIPGTPVREGYKFVGWSKSATDRTKVKDTFTITGDTTFYAVWDKLVDSEPEIDGDTQTVTIGTVDAANEAVLVETSASKGKALTLTFTDKDGAAQTLTAQTNGKGCVVFDLRDYVAVTDAVLSAPASIKIESVVCTSYESANDAANTVNGGGSNGSASVGGGDTGKKDYSDKNTVTDITKPGEINPDEANNPDGKSVIKDTMSEETVLFNFDEEYQKDFFKSFRQMSITSMADSVLTLTAIGYKEGSKEGPAMFTTDIALDAATHRYVVVKAKKSNISDPTLQLYFRAEGGAFSEGNSIKKQMDDEYTMLVYDMSEKADWKGKITSLFFSLVGDQKGTVDIDWIMFTDKVPASMDEIEGAKVAFPVVNKGDMPFTDVPAGEWYAPEIANAYKLGFVEGTSATTYEPEGSVTIAEAVTLAVRLNHIYNGKELPKAASGAEWYTPFVTAAVKAGIIKNNQFTEYDVPAARKYVAAIMAKALPADFYVKINMFTEIPDMDKKDPNYSAVLKLYNAGILQGSDDAYNFLPETNITRSEMAAIVNRTADPKNRKRIVTEAEIESRKKKIYADELASIAALGNCTAQKLVVKDGIAYATGKANDAGRSDPIVYFKDAVGSDVNGKEITKITVGMKWDESKTKAAAQIYFTTPTGSWAAERMLTGTKGTPDENGVVPFVFETSKNGQFANTITGLRFDPFDAAEEFGIAYIIVE